MTAGTPNYMAPELFLSKPYSTPVDVFAFGVLLNEMWAREVPWDGYAPMDIKAKVTEGERPATSSTMPMQCETLLRKLWHQTASLRPSFEEVALPLERVMETLPGRASSSNSIGGMGGGMDALDALDSLAGLSLKPQRR